MLTKIINHLLSLKRLYKNLIIVASDYFLLTFSFWLSLSIRDNLIYIPTFENNILIFLGPFIAIPIFYFSGLYQSIIRYSNIQSLLTIIKAVSIYTLLWFLLVLSVGIVSKPYDFLIINWLVTIFLTGAIRYSAQGILGNRFSQRNVLIFGAGSAGIQLEAALKYDFNYKVIAFIDKNKDLNGKLISGKRVESISSLDWLIPKKSIAEILIAIPSLSRKERYKLLQNLKRYPVIIKSIPSLSDLADGKLAISDMKKRLGELKTQTMGFPRYICIINPKVEYNEELQELLASNFDFEETEYHIVLSLVESGDLSLIDEAFKHGKNGWVYVGSSNEEIRTDIIEKVHNRINIELRRLVVIEPYDKNNNGFIFQTAIYKLLGGNSVFTVEGEDQEVTFREKLSEMEIVDPDLVSSWEDFINGTP